MENTQAYLKPRFTGRRFENHGIPMSLLKDFSVLEDIIKSVAKHLYRTERDTRVPANFLDDVSIQMTGVEAGSCIPVFTLVMLGGGLLPGIQIETEASLYTEKARDVIIQELSNAESSDKYSSSIPNSILRKFNQFGVGLRDDEAMRHEGSTMPFSNGTCSSFPWKNSPMY